MGYVVYSIKCLVYSHTGVIVVLWYYLHRAPHIDNVRLYYLWCLPVSSCLWAVILILKLEKLERILSISAISDPLIVSDFRVDLLNYLSNVNIVVLTINLLSFNLI